MAGQPQVEINQLEPSIVTALNLLTTGYSGLAGTVLTVTAGNTLAWQNPPTLPSSLNTLLGTFSDVSLTSLASGEILQWNGTQWQNAAAGGAVTSVGIVAGGTNPGFTVSNSPITSSGNITLTLSSELQGLALLSTTGFVQRTGTGAYTATGLTSSQITSALGYTPGTGNGTVTNIAISTTSTGLAVSGSPISTSGTVVLTLNSELQGLAGMTATGLVTRTGTGSYANVSITGSSDFTITNGNGVNGNPRIALSGSGVTAGTYTHANITVSSGGRVTAASNGTLTLSGDVTGTLSGNNISVTLGSTGVTAGTYGDATDVPRITVNSKGLVTGATTTPVALHTNSNTQINSLGVGTPASGTTGEIRATNNITSYYSSDIHLKENIQPISNALNKVEQVRGVTFDWTDEFIEQHGGADDYFIRKHDVGVIAQEVENVLPEVVATRPDGIKAVKYDRIVALLIEAVKELNAEVKDLQQRLAGGR